MFLTDFCLYFMANQAFPPKFRQFSRLLLKWDKEENNRAMPWKGEKDPYRIWISEIILQQTRVDQGLAYYQKFIKNFTRIEDLANATDEKVFKIWEGLGYYTRCRNLLSTARFISKSLNGKFPSNYTDILELKGVGPYTAAAISSFAFNLPYAVIDGNVFRVLSRLTGISEPIDSTEGKKIFNSLANEWLDKKQPGKYNQAIMDFGASVCKPQSPLCEDCPFRSVCFAFQNGRIPELPVKTKKQKLKSRYFYYFILNYKKEKAVRLRDKKDIWQGLYEFPLIEMPAPAGIDELLDIAEKNKWLKKGKYKLLSVSVNFKQLLSHQKLEGQFIEISLKQPPDIENLKWVSPALMKKLAFPRFINKYLEINLQ